MAIDHPQAPARCCRLCRCHPLGNQGWPQPCAGGRAGRIGRVLTTRVHDCKSEGCAWGGGEPRGSAWCSDGVRAPRADRWGWWAPRRSRASLGRGSEQRLRAEEHRSGLRLGEEGPRTQKVFRLPFCCCLIKPKGRAMGGCVLKQLLRDPHPPFPLFSLHQCRYQ